MFMVTAATWPFKCGSLLRYFGPTFLTLFRLITQITLSLVLDFFFLCRVRPNMSFDGINCSLVITGLFLYTDASNDRA